MEYTLDGPYFLFAGLRYYPSSGLGDYKGSFVTVARAQAAFLAGDRCDDWATIAAVRDGQLAVIVEGHRRFELDDHVVEWERPKEEIHDPNRPA